MRPSYVAWIVIGLLVAIDVGVTSLIVLTQAAGGKPWHYWIGPVMTLQAALLVLALVFGYFWKVGRLEIRSTRHSSE